MSDDLIKRLRNRKVFNGNITVRRDGPGGPWIEERQTETDPLCAEAAAALVEAQAEVARLSTLEGAADRVLRFITDPDWADQNSEVFRTTPWQTLYKEMQKDRGDFPAMVRTFLEAFACADSRDELRRAALLPVARCQHDDGVV